MATRKKKAAAAAKHKQLSDAPLRQGELMDGRLEIAPMEPVTRVSVLAPEEGEPLKRTGVVVDRAPELVVPERWLIRFDADIGKQHKYLWVEADACTIEPVTLPEPGDDDPPPDPSQTPRVDEQPEHEEADGLLF